MICKKVKSLWGRLSSSKPVPPDIAKSFPSTIGTGLLEYGRRVTRRCRPGEQAPVIHAASHFDHEKKRIVAWFSISKHACMIDENKQVWLNSMGLDFTLFRKAQPSLFRVLHLDDPVLLFRHGGPCRKQRLMHAWPAYMWFCSNIYGATLGGPSGS